MATLKGKLLRDSLNGHKWLGWTGGLALLIFALSGISHPVMTWTGPKAVSFFPPQTEIKAAHAAAIPDILVQHGIEQAIMVKAIPSQTGPVMQVTESNAGARRYFNLDTGEELADHDAQQARWLARYYTGLKDTPIKSVVFQSEFDDAYPWVNRLLPVYRVTFDTDDHLTAFVYTELGALANLTNDWKTSIQSLFRALHTWDWVNDMEHARVLLMMLFLLSLLGMAVTGTAMVFMLKNRKMKKRVKWHRAIAYGIWLPLTMFSASGIYHLLQYAYGDNHRGLQLVKFINVHADRFGGNFDWLQPYQHIKLNGLSVVEGPNGDLVYRLSIPQGRPGQTIERSKRFDGVPIEKPALYFNGRTGAETEFTDREMAIFYAGQQLGMDEQLISNTTLVKRFGPHYDFRNKRLPVWQIDYDSALGDKVFIDPATGMLVDRLVNKERYEGYSFSFLHKWNFMTPLIGRPARDALIVLLMCIAVISTILGYLMLLKRKTRKRPLVRQPLLETAK